MTKKINITVQNKLKKEKKYVNVYHHSNRSAHIISYNNSLTSAIKSVEEDDYLHISVVSGPGNFSTDCVLNLPSFIDFNFWATGEVTLAHSGKRTLLKIPPGPPTWELKMTIPTPSSALDPLNEDYITIGGVDQSQE